MPGQHNTTTPEAEADLWRTPPEVFALAKSFISPGEFVIDVAATQSNSLCESYIDERTDGLKVEWSLLGWAFCNPPYSRGNLPRWTLKSVHEALAGRQSVLLLPFTGEEWFCEHVVGRAQIVVLRPRVAFLRPDGSVGGSPRTASCLAIYRAGAKYDGPLTVERWRA